MTATGQVRFALVGVGSIGEVHGTNLESRIPNARLEAIVDAVPERLEAASRKLRVKKASTDLGSVLADPEVDAVVLAVPTFLKLDMIKKVAAAGKHIFCEKPMALSVQQADEAVAALGQAGVKFQVGYQRRFDRPHLKARQAVEDGSLGTLEMVSSRTRDPPGNPQGWGADPALSGGIWLDTVSHDFDSIRFLTGAEVTKVYAEAATLAYEQLKPKGGYDNVVISMKLSNGAIAYVDSCAWTPYGYEVRVELVGTKAAAVIEMGDNSSYNLLGAATARADDTPQSFQERFAQAYHDELEDFARCILEDDAPKVGVGDGREAINIGMAAWESVKQQKPIVLR